MKYMIYLALILLAGYLFDMLINSNQQSSFEYEWCHTHPEYELQIVTDDSIGANNIIFDTSYQEQDSSGYVLHTEYRLTK